MNINLLIVIIIIIIIFSITASSYLLYKFIKMMRILLIKEDDDNYKDLLLLSQGILYRPISDIYPDREDVIQANIENIKEILNNQPEEYKSKYNHGEFNNINEMTTAEHIITFYNNNKELNLPTPFNGGDNKYKKNYKIITYMGTTISVIALIVSIISLIIMFKRTKI